MADTEGHAAAPRILVVDDEPSMRLLCRVNLELEGHEVFEADSLTTARTMVENEDIDLVLLDVHLRGARSAALISECHAPRPPIPVMTVTCHADITQPARREAD